MPSTFSVIWLLPIYIQVRTYSQMLDEPLDNAIREFNPVDSNWLPLEAHLQLAFSSPDPTIYYHAIFNLFERFPQDDGNGVFWSALHGMEAVGNYDYLLLQYFRRCPSLMTRTMLRRMKNAGVTFNRKLSNR